MQSVESCFFFFFSGPSNGFRCTSMPYPPSYGMPVCVVAHTVLLKSVTKYVGGKNSPNLSPSNFTREWSDVHLSKTKNSPNLTQKIVGDFWGEIWIVFFLRYPVTLFSTTHHCTGVRRPTDQGTECKAVSGGDWLPVPRATAWLKRWWRWCLMR